MRQRLIVSLRRAIQRCQGILQRGEAQEGGTASFAGGIVGNRGSLAAVKAPSSIWRLRSIIRVRSWLASRSTSVTYANGRR